MDEITNAIKKIISYIGDDPNREGLLKTPGRFVSVLSSLFSGYNFDSSLHLKKYRVEWKPNDMVVFKDIDFISYCEHHILPMVGKVNIAYVPNGYIIGIGDAMKVVEGCTRKLQLQERITFDIANLLYENLESIGVAVVIKATHSCLMCDNNLKMYSTTMLGEFEHLPHRRQEFYSMLSL